MMTKSEQILASIDRNLKRIADAIEKKPRKYAKNSLGDIVNLEMNCCEGCDGWDTCAGKELHDGTVEIKEKDLPTIDN